MASVNQAYKDGRKTFRVGTAYASNPYHPCTYGFTAWNHGWQDAAEYHWRGIVEEHYLFNMVNQIVGRRK